MIVIVFTDLSLTFDPGPRPISRQSIHIPFSLQRPRPMQPAAALGYAQAIKEISENSTTDTRVTKYLMFTVSKYRSAVFQHRYMKVFIVEMMSTVEKNGNYLFEQDKSPVMGEFVFIGRCTGRRAGMLAREAGPRPGHGRDTRGLTPPSRTPTPGHLPSSSQLALELVHILSVSVPGTRRLGRRRKA
ncbi:hypothetical protein EVAR_95401_1 [Eumeta japonica]|uniref:Uncharacterized protein n=1 Tax=Eumeta variegata TaxID=151549 RepID=A0A4C1VIZ9_EUMVA|nr:hypothetical protein EVAR_95401_1 [Eumeta japonica]